MSAVAPRAVHAYAYDDPSGAPVAVHESATSAAPSYTGDGDAHETTMAGRASAVTVTWAVPGSAFADDAVTRYSYVSSDATVAGTANEGDETSVALSRSVPAVAPRAVHEYA